jgi:hypothetical protein
MFRTLSSASGSAGLVCTVKHNRGAFLEPNCPSLGFDLACLGLHGPGSGALSRSKMPHARRAQSRRSSDTSLRLPWCVVCPSKEDQLRCCPSWLAIGSRRAPHWRADVYPRADVHLRADAHPSAESNDQVAVSWRGGFTLRQRQRLAIHHAMPARRTANLTCMAHTSISPPGAARVGTLEAARPVWRFLARSETPVPGARADQCLPHRHPTCLLSMATVEPEPSS